MGQACKALFEKENSWVRRIRQKRILAEELNAKFSY
jgi:hypothetical protein